MLELCQYRPPPTFELEPSNVVYATFNGRSRSSLRLGVTYRCAGGAPVLRERVPEEYSLGQVRVLASVQLNVTEVSSCTGC
jgi:hypothetical protein